VAIHAFPNGNGRHGRIAADLLVQATGMARFSWGSNLRVDTPRLRSAYTQALQRADRGDVEALVAFART
jgi:Fic family protein